MPHPTPYSQQFDAIRSAFPGLFERPCDEPRALAHTNGSAATADSPRESTGKPDGK